MTTTELSATLDCPSCHGDSFLVAHGVIAPFVTEIARLRRGSETDLRACQGCGLTFFSARYRDQDMDLLYQSYRGNDYLTIRRRWEPWYSRRVNDAYGAGTTTLQDRRDFMTGILHEAGMKGPVACALDFGGDSGQFFPDLAIDRRVLIDPSQSLIPTGVERIPTIHSLSGSRPDLVIVAHVLEHLPDPRTPLQEIRDVMAADGILYVEVPVDGFTTRLAHTRSGYRRFLQVLSNHRLLFASVDFVSGLSRQYRHAIPRFGIVKQSEHINFFSRLSLLDLLARTGYSVACERFEPDAQVGGLRIGRYGIAARPMRAGN
jgi:hypothetical protein